jgi:glycosyltransferase involved in cell wall biosynthesis
MNAPLQLSRSSKLVRCLPADRRPNVLHTALRVGKSSFGIGAAVLGLAQGQQNIGLRAAVWSTDSEAERLELERSCRLQADSVRVFPRYGPHLLGFCPTMERAACTGSQEYDVLHQHGVWTGISRVSVRWRKTLRRPTVVNAEGALDPWALRRSRWKKHLAWTAYEQQNLGEASCIQALSAAEAAFLRTLRIPSPIAVIPNGVPASLLRTQGEPSRFFDRFGLPDDVRILLFLGRITPKKGLLMLLDALYSIRPHAQDWLLLIAGVDEHNHQDEVRAQARHLALDKLVRFIGPLYGQDKRDAFAAAQLFVLPSHSEGAPMTILESMACSVPVLTTDASPWNILNVLQCGWCTSATAQALADALVDALSQSPSSLHEKGIACQSLIAAEYTWEKIAGQTADLYQWLVAGGAAPGFVLER